MRLYHSQCSTCPLFLLGLFLFFCGPVLLRWFPFLTAEAATIAVLILFPFFPGSRFFSTLHVVDIFPLYSEVTRSKAVDGLLLRRRRRALLSGRLGSHPLRRHLRLSVRSLLFPGALALSFEFFLFLALLHHLLDALFLSFLFAQFPESSLLLLSLALELSLLLLALLLLQRLLGAKIFTLHRTELRSLAHVDHHRLRRALPAARQERFGGDAARGALDRSRVAEKRRRRFSARRRKHRRGGGGEGTARHGLSDGASGEIRHAVRERERILRGAAHEALLGLPTRPKGEMRVLRRTLLRRRPSLSEQTGRQIHLLGSREARGTTS